MIRMKVIGILICSVFVTAILSGCAKNELPSINDPKYAISQPVDADKNGVIDEKDIQTLKAKADDCFNVNVLPFFQKAGIKIESEKDINTEENTNILKNTLTVAEWEKLTDGVNEWNKIRIQLEITKMGLDNKPITIDSGIVRGLCYYPDRLICFLDDNRYIYLIGISVPDHTSRYRKMSEDLFFKMVLNKTIKIEYDTLKSNADWLMGYVYIGDVFVNSEMIAKGYAKATPTASNSKYDELFKKLEKEARENKRGIWALTEEF